jgi:hypothetical protein
MAYISAILVTFMMIVGFSVIMMKFTGYWPCKIGEALEIMDISCGKNFQQNMDVILNSSHISLPFHFPLLSLQNIAQW